MRHHFSAKLVDPPRATFRPRMNTLLLSAL